MPSCFLEGLKPSLPVNWENVGMSQEFLIMYAVCEHTVMTISMQIGQKGDDLFLTLGYGPTLLMVLFPQQPTHFWINQQTPSKEVQNRRTELMWAEPSAGGSHHIGIPATPWVVKTPNSHNIQWFISWHCNQPNNDWCTNIYINAKTNILNRSPRKKLEIQDDEISVSTFQILASDYQSHVHPWGLCQVQCRYCCFYWQKQNYNSLIKANLMAGARK